MTPSPDIIRDFSRLQADVYRLSKANNLFAQDNLKLRDELKELREDKRRLDGLEATPYQLEIVCKQSRPKTQGLPTLREQIDFYLSNAPGQASPTA